MVSESDVRHDQLQAAGAIRPSLPCGVSMWRGGPFWKPGQSFWIVASESGVRHAQLPAPGVTKSSIPSLWGRRQWAAPLLVGLQNLQIMGFPT